jgi:hypothetical protein
MTLEVEIIPLPPDMEAEYWAAMLILWTWIKEAQPLDGRAALGDGMEHGRFAPVEWMIARKF